MSAAVIVALRVAADPQTAFTAFTRDIGLWWQSHPLLQLSRRGDGTLRFDPAGPGGRLVPLFLTLAALVLVTTGQRVVWAARHL